METLLKYFAKNKILVNIMIIIIIILGAIGIMNIKQDLFPQATLDSMIVSFVYPGAAPIDVEKNAIIPIERKLKTISGIKKYTSMSMENQGRIIITIDEDGNDVKDVKAEITRELQSIPDLAEDIDHINIIDANPDKMPVYELGVYIQDGAGISEKELYNFVDTLERKLLKVDGVSDVSDEGYREKEIKINVSPDKMAKYYISLNEIVNSIQKRNERVTGGTLQSVNEDKSIVTIGQFEKPIEVGEVIIRSNFDGERVLVKDIADIEEGFKKSSIDVKKLREKYKVYAFSNTNTIHKEVNKRRGLYDPFEEVFLSCDLGVVKPAEEIFHKVLEKIDLPANKVLFIDDNEDNIKTAKKLGMKDIQFKDYESLIEDLYKEGIKV